MKQLLLDLFLLSFGAGVGISALCLVQAAGLTGKWNDLKGEVKNEFWTEFIQLVFKQCTIVGAYGNRGNWGVSWIQEGVFKTYRVLSDCLDCCRFGI